ncbi:hypothetical protein LCGC14_1052330 [marine sediment metagenome]|uniref:Glycosyltransferase 2-like domain-containing protein n=1 Tax=marine sediment metagenome TaxID=412755 RepID=A0A0F9MSX7_9ZZZZ
MTRKVSIIINNYNKKPYLKRCLDSVLEQTYENWEIIFWDDNSTDDGRNWAFHYLNMTCPDKFYCYDTKQLIDNPNFDLPLGVVRWMAAQKAKGDYIAFLDADDYWHPRKLEKQMKLFEENHDMKLVFSDCQYFADKIIQVDNYPAWTSEQYTFGTFHEKYRPLMDNDPFMGLLLGYKLKPWLNSNFMPMSTLVFEREAFFKVMGKSTHYTSGEDFDWLFKMTAKYDCGLVPEVLSYYRINVRGSVNNQISMSLKAQWNEIDVIKKAKGYRELTRWQTVRFYFRLFVMYSKLIFKQCQEVKVL